MNTLRAWGVLAPLVTDMKKNKVVGPQKARRTDDCGEKDSVAARLRGQRKILELFGTVDFDPSYDYKAARRRKRT